MPRIDKTGEQIASWFPDQDDVLNGWMGEVIDPEELLDQTHPKPGMLYLDLGCSSGRALAVALERSMDATGIEITPESAAFSQKNAPGAQVVVGSAQEIPFESNYFDRVTCFGMIEFFTNPTGGMLEIHRVLKPGGVACLVLPNAHYLGLKSKDNPIFNDDMFDVYYPLSTWKYMIEATGFKILRRIYKPDHTHPDTLNNTFFEKVKCTIMTFLAKWIPKKFAAQFVCICQKK